MRECGERSPQPTRRADRCAGSRGTCRTSLPWRGARWLQKAQLPVWCYLYTKQVGAPRVSTLTPEGQKNLSSTWSATETPLTPPAYLHSSLLAKSSLFCGFHCSQELMDCKGIHQVPVRFPFYVSVAVVSDAGNWVQSGITVKGCVGVSQKGRGPGRLRWPHSRPNYSGVGVSREGWGHSLSLEEGFV